MDNHWSNKAWLIKAITCRAFFALIVLAGLLTSASASAMAAETPSLPALLALARAAGESGAGEGGADVARLILADATSPQLRRLEGDVDFPLSIGIDLPLDAQPKPLTEALMTGGDHARHAVLFEVALAKASRRVRDIKAKTSRKVTNVNRIDNPNYLRAVKLFGAYSAKLERAPGNTKLLNLFEDARSKLETTPQFLEQPVYGEYTYQLADLECRKVLTVNYYVIDRQAGTYVTTVFDVTESQNFTLAYGLDPSDTAQGANRADIASETQVRDWERAPVVVPLSQLLDHAVALWPQAQPLGSPQSLLDRIAATRTRASQQAFAQDYDSRPLDDPRFDSVVAIYTPGGMGSGVFVTSNIVMTNWHVVERHPIVEMRLYDRRETFGQVIAKDVRLDLALVKVQTRGRPVAFLEGKTLKPGDMVEAIGHPRQHLFTITRGVVSAIRKQHARTNPTQGAAPPVLYVQTDADINPGNSGGPLFKGDRLVGINTWTSNNISDGIAVPAPGLNFAVHYAEARDFLNQALKGQ